MYTLKSYSKYSYVQVLTIPREDIDKIDFMLCNQPTETPDAVYARLPKKPKFLFNGGFFDMSNGQTCFSFIDEGKAHTYSTYLGVGITNNKDLTLSKHTTNFRDFIAAYPVLIQDGKQVAITYAKEINYNARRTCIGWNADNFYAVFVDKPGLTFSTIQAIFLELGATHAINLDGGGSTRLLVDGKRKTAESYARPIDNVVCIYMKDEPIKEEPKTIYRVQVGAFCVKSNADRFLADIKALGYEDAYVRKIGIYYKVQVGAFYVKLNAERLLDELESHGYKPFITTA